MHPAIPIGVPLRGAARGAVLLVALVALVSSASAQIVLSEVFYDAVGSDDEREWIELVNESDAPVDLAGFSLGWGGSTYLSGTQALAGVVPPGGVFVVGGPLADESNARPVFDLAVDLEADLQNGGATADGVALFDVPVEELLAESVPLDAVLYGETNDSGLLGPFGVPAPVDVADAPSGSSIERGADGLWRVQPVPTPGIAATVPEPRGAALGLASVLVLGALRARRSRAARRESQSKNCAIQRR